MTPSSRPGAQALAVVSHGLRHGLAIGLWAATLAVAHMYNKNRSHDRPPRNLADLVSLVASSFSPRRLRSWALSVIHKLDLIVETEIRRLYLIAASDRAR